ncbi:MAG TPA: aminoacyl-tRNA hydrolase [Dehalococcoidia bacterium]|nr:aminoacyl-tRNA hydrolase [Dehalococcoidia bacterium]
MKLIVGLGNPGRAYVNTRHNIGFECLNLFARKEGIVWARRQAKARIGFGEVAGEKVILAKPLTFVNLSGQSVGPLVRYYRIAPDDILVVYDDVDFPLGKIRIREGGGAGGHNGMKSIIEHLKIHDFPRIRVGIGPLPEVEPGGPAEKMRSREYVLGHFTFDERAVLAEVYPRVTEAIFCILSEGVTTAMNRYNLG